MADSLHNTLASFRDSILQSIAQLEFQLRDSAAVSQTAHSASSHMSFESPREINLVHQKIMSIEKKLDSIEAFSNVRVNEHPPGMDMLQQILSRVEALEISLHTPIKKVHSDSLNEIEEILTIQPEPTTKNIVISSVRSTPALAAAIAAVHPHPIVLDSTSEHSGEVIEDSEEEEEEDSGPELTKVIIKGVPYYMDSSNTVYQETEDGYEEVGTYNPKLDCIEVVKEEEEEEEEAIETEEFIYKGKTYQRDTEGNVYNEEGEVIGFWNGKKIVAAAVA